MNKRIFGTWMVSGSLFSANVIAESDLDFAVIDLEHGHFNRNEIPIIVKILHLGNKKACIRTNSHLSHEILNSLDAGPDIILIPSVNTIEDVKEIIRNVYFYPEGERGSSGCTHANGFSKLNFDDFKLDRNKNLQIGFMIETKKGLDNLIEMAKKMPRNSLIYFGTYDLAESYGINDPYSNELLEKINVLVNEIKNIHPDLEFGIVANGKGDDYVPDYITFLPLFGDAGLYLRCLNNVLSKYK